MIKVLFVDDERQVLEGLRRRLYRQRSKWDMHFAESGSKALELLAEGCFDVVVSDMRMPEMDGATLLREIHDRYPRTVRIVLSGYAEAEMALRVVPVAHQFLNKPCEADVIESVIDRACDLQRLLEDDALRQMVAGIQSLPSPPRLYTRLVAAMSDESATTGQIAEILKQDMALCAKMLQLVNSAFFGLSRTIARVEEAVAYLGMNTIRNVVLATEVFQQGERDDGDASLRTLQTHSMLVGYIARLVGGSRDDKEDAYAAGLLHDIGKLILMTRCPEEYQSLRREARSTNAPFFLIEQQRRGVTHAELGAYLLGLWGLPYPIIEAVANHHQPGRVSGSEVGVLAAVHIADAIAHEDSGQAPGARTEEMPLLDLEYVKRIGAAEEISGWRELAREIRAAEVAAE